MTDEIRIRRATEVDIPLIGKLLLQVHRVHSDVRPDLFRKGGRKYTDEELKEIFSDESRPIFVAERDGEKESCALARRFNTDLYNMLSKLTGMYSGRINLGHMTYTEIRFWGEKTLATPDGRYDGDYFAQGLTPSRLKRIPYVTDVINSMTALDKTELGGNNIINIILPGPTKLDICGVFLRAAAQSAVEAL